MKISVTIFLTIVMMMHTLPRIQECLLQKNDDTDYATGRNKTMWAFQAKGNEDFINDVLLLGGKGDFSLRCNQPNGD